MRLKGISLIEVVVGLSIILIFTYFAHIYAREMVFKAQMSTLSYNLRKIRGALQDFAKDRGYYPSSLGELTKEVAGGYSYLRKIPIDPTTGVADWEIKKGSSDALNIPGGPIVYYPFSENSGTIAYDHGALPADDGTLRNGVSWTSGYIDTALSFDGSSGYLYLDDPNTNSNPTFDDRITVRSGVFWYYATSVNGQIKTIYEEGATVNGLNVYIKNGKVYAGAWSESDSWNGVWISTNTTANAWHQVVYVFDSTNGIFKLYYDGKFATSATVPTSIAPHSGNDAIGMNVDGTKWNTGDDSSAGEYFAGKIDEVRFYDYALTDSDVAALYKTKASPEWYERTDEFLVSGEILDIRSNNSLYQKK
jgi:type II secretory pathway pseudopilin PulG